MKEPKLQIAIKLLDFQVSELLMSNSSLFSNKKKKNEFEIKIGYKIEYFVLQDKSKIIDENRNYTVNFSVLLTDNKKGLNIKLNASALFEAQNQITEEFKNSHFVKTNSPAIAFPYLRSFITTLTSNTGIGQVILPTMNFSQMESEDK
jgi:preprotein translocase subunit SecB